MSTRTIIVFDKDEEGDLVAFLTSNSWEFEPLWPKSADLATPHTRLWFSIKLDAAPLVLLKDFMDAANTPPPPNHYDDYPISKPLHEILDELDLKTGGSTE